MILRVLFLAVICSSFHPMQTDEGLIPWEASRRLQWDDFQAVPPEGARNAALTSSSILMKFGTRGTTLRYEISCNFDKKRSWGRIKNDHILAHEQGHFDITEIAARRLNRALKEYRPEMSSVNKDVNLIYQRQMDALSEMQNQYDTETDHSRNFEQQKNWLVRIGSKLKELEEFGEY